MPSYIQADRPLVLQTPLGNDVLLLTGLRGEEAVSRPFHFTLEMLNEPTRPVSFSKLLDQVVTVTLRLSGAPERYINGVVTRVVQGPQVRVVKVEGLLVRYRAEIVPRFAMLKKRVQIRIFQQKSVPAILKQVLGGLDTRFQLTG
ncbi:MAG: contractile injection system protein, VgrG/Pvc8 family, partial [Gemmataceae bacterium]